MSYERSKAPLALMEQIIMILVFALTAAVCLQAFVYSNQLSKEGERQNVAAVYAQEIAEYCKTEKGNMDILCQQLAGEKIADGFVVSKPEERMKIVVQLSENSDYIQKAKVSVTSYEGTTYYTMDIAWQKGGV